MARQLACLGLTAGLVSIQGARIRNRKAERTTRIAGVPVHNYQEEANDWIILFGQNATDETILNACRGRCDLVGHPSKGGVPFAHVRGKEPFTALLAESSGTIELVEPDMEDHAIPVLEESDVGTAASLASWGLDIVGVAERVTTGKGVHIYVQDTGVRVSHNDFGGRAVAFLDFSSGSMVECNGEVGCASDMAGHGTHVAGTTGGDKYGVAPGATIHAIKTLRDSGSGQRAWNIASIDYIASSGRRPAVINLSLGGKGEDPLYLAAIDTASARGVTVVVAAGNFGSDACTYSPAFVPSAITVGAMGGEQKRASYSNFGSCNDIMAPGTSITSASQIADSMTARLTGTSMACPHVAGGAALLLERNPWWNRDAIMSHMQNFARKNYMKSLKEGDPDLLLWVGPNKAPGKPACPEYASRTEPNYWGDCQCSGGKFCSLDGSSRNCPTSYGVGGWGGDHFSWKCTDCRCY